jgi:manganese transport protein
MVNGEENINGLIVLSQVILSLQLGFAVIPLIHFVSDKKTMGKFRIKPIVQVIAWLIAVILIYLNIRMVIEQFWGYFSNPGHLFLKMLIITGVLLFAGLLLVALIYPLLKPIPKNVSLDMHKKSPCDIDDILPPFYKKIAVALDFSSRDLQLIAHAIKQSNAQTEIILIHIVESASAKVLGVESDDLETRKDQEKLDEYVQYLEHKGFKAESRLGFRNRNKEIPKLVESAGAQLLVIGSHGHSGVKDWLYGETIEAVRHRLKIPVLIVSA